MNHINNPTRYAANLQTTQTPDSVIALIPFDPTVPCTDTGFDLSAGKKYTIEFKVPPNWTDATIDADTYGILKSPSFGMTLAAPLRRHISKDWFQPIGRIGHKFYDRYTAKLKDSDKTVVNPDYVRNPEYCSSITFEARQTGRLYLYLNDAIAPWPFETWTFYENNCEAGFCRKDELAKLRITEEENVGEQTLCK